MSKGRSEALAPMPVFTRKAVRRSLVDVVGNAVPQVQEWIQGRAKVLIGFKNHDELAEKFYELWVVRVDPDADRVTPWLSLTQQERDAYVDAFRDLTGNKLTLRQIAVQVGVVGQQEAFRMAAQFGLGSQSSNVDDEGNALPGVVYLPQAEMASIAERQARLLARSDMFEQVEDVEFVVETIDSETQDVLPGEAELLPAIEERVNPELVRHVRAKFAARNGKNGNGNGNGH